MKKIDLKNYKKPSDYLSFSQGKNQIRLVTTLVFAKIHGSRMRGRYMNLGVCTEDGNCQLCAQGNEAKQKWRGLAIDRSINEVRLLDAGPVIGNQICEKLSERGLDFTDCELIITKTGEGLKTQYDVQIGEKKPLTVEEQEGIKSVKAFLINKYFKA